MSYTNSEVISRFVDGKETGKSSYWSERGQYRLRIEDHRLVNYNTTIGFRLESYIIINNDSYSKTTSRHQNRLKECVRLSQYTGLLVPEEVLQVLEGNTIFTASVIEIILKEGEILK